MDVSKYYDAVIELFPDYEKAFEMLTNVNGFSIDVINDGIYSITGYRSLDDYVSNELD